MYRSLNSKMKLIVFGSTGQSGQAVLKVGTQEKGLEVTAFARTPSKILSEVRNKLKVVVGDVQNPDDVCKAIEGMDGVISCLGTGYDFGKTTVLSKGIENIVDGMRKHGVKKLMVINVSFLLPGKQWSPGILKNINDDHERALNFLRKTKDIQWVALMPPEIVNMPYGGSFKTAINKVPGAPVVATLDMAEWMLDCIRDDGDMAEYTHQLVGISSSISNYNWLIRTFLGKITLFGIGLLSIAVLVYARFFM